VIAKLGAAARYLLGNDFAGRNLRTYPDDTFLASYAKSGNTWTRFLVASLLHPGDPMTLVRADELIPSTTLTRRYLNSVPRPRILKSHFPFDPGYRRVIYIVRDPKDVVVSQYHFKIKRGILPAGYPKNLSPALSAGKRRPTAPGASTSEVGWPRVWVIPIFSCCAMKICTSARR
jgi:hypothetical protein